MDRFRAQLREQGLRNTPQRRAVLAALAAHPHAAATDVAAAVAQTVGELSRQGLYNVLDDLRRAGLVRSIEPAGSPALFELQGGDNHHHFVCRECGQVRDVACAVGAAPCLDPGAGDFVVDEAEVIWWGRCGECARAVRS